MYSIIFYVIIQALGRTDIEILRRSAMSIPNLRIITPTTQKVGDHLRVSSNKFQEPGRRCSHVVVQSIQDNIVYVNSYLGHKFKDWALKPDCPYKQQKYYIRPSQKRKDTGLCVKCGTSKVQPPYYKCIFCKNQKKFKGI